MSLERRISSAARDDSTGNQDAALSEVMRDFKLSKGGKPLQLSQLFGPPANHDEELLRRQLGPRKKEDFDRKDQYDRHRYQEMRPDERFEYDRLNRKEQWDRDHETP